MNYEVAEIANAIFFIILIGVWFSLENQIMYLHMFDTKDAKVSIERGDFRDSVIVEGVDVNGERLYLRMYCDDSAVINPTIVGDLITEVSDE